MDMLTGKCNDLCVCLCVRVRERERMCVYPHNPLFQLPSVCQGKLSHIAVAEIQDRVKASYNLDTPLHIERPG